jgi:hypothetical protein
VTKRPVVLAIALFGTFTLAACTGAPGATTDGLPAPAAADGGASDATSCLLGTWHLDVPDYESQAKAYFAANGLPAEALALSGTQSMEFTDSEVSVDQALEFSTTLAGRTMVQPFSSVGKADWKWIDEGESLQLDNATWMPGALTGTDSSAVPSMGIPGNGIVEVECTASTLRFGGEDATLAGNFTR